MLIHPDRLFPAEASTRKIARTLYEQCANVAYRQSARAYAGGVVCEERAFP